MRLLIALSFLALTACSPAEQSTSTDQPPAAVEPAEQTASPVASESISPLKAAVEMQSAEHKARYQYRNPEQTLEFFGIEPGSTVVEALPGGGWYSKILLPLLGPQGQLIGANYAKTLWPNFSFASEEFLAGINDWATTWPEGTAEMQGSPDTPTPVSAFMFEELPESMKGTADAVLLVRALHNMARFEAQGGFLTNAMQDVYDVLKPGGVVGVVQHEARAEMPDEWADGSRGYLKRDFVISVMENAGFVFEEASDINQNEKDVPTADDVVWRLPPSLNGAQDNPEQLAKVTEIGESNRMTLRFRKPS